MKHLIWLPYAKQITFFIGKWQFVCGFINAQWLMEQQQGGMDMNDLSKKLHKDMGCKCPNCKTIDYVAHKQIIELFCKGCNKIITVRKRLN